MFTAGIGGEITSLMYGQLDGISGRDAVTETRIRDHARIRGSMDARVWDARYRG